MRKEPKEHLDRDSLLLFRTLCATHNLQRAASQLGMPQATASRSLTKLREAFEDELFTRCSGGLTPTPKALALEPKVAAVIASFEDLFVEETFEPASLVREFRIACADHAMFYIEPAVTLASRTAPGVTFRLSPNGDDWLVELQRGDLDFAIFPIERAPEGCACLPLSSCRSVLVVRSDHPLARRFDEAGALTLEECLAHRYVEVRTGPEWVFKAMDASVSEAWIARPRAVRTPAGPSEERGSGRAGVPACGGEVRMREVDAGRREERGRRPALLSREPRRSRQATSFAAFSPAIWPKTKQSRTALPPTRFVPWMPPVISPAA